MGSGSEFRVEDFRVSRMAALGLGLGFRVGNIGVEMLAEGV